MVLDPSLARPTPWRNGAGATRELAAAVDPDGDIRWRISLADLDRPAAFSAFPDMERIFTALGELRLTIDGTEVELGSGGQVRFPGEAVVAVSIVRPTQALNVITRRGVCFAEVLLRAAGEAVTVGTDATVLLGAVVADVLLNPLTMEN